MSTWSTWVNHRFLSADRVERHFAYLLSLILTLTLLFIFIKPIGPVPIAPIDSVAPSTPSAPPSFSLGPLLWGAPLCTLWSLALISLTLVRLHGEATEQAKYTEPAKAVMFVLLLLVVLIFYDGTNVVARYRFSLHSTAMLYDQALLSMDTFLLGWLFPKGQIALFLDLNTSIGVTTFFGRCYAELLQLMYISYYFWGNVLGVWIAWDYFYNSVYRNQRSATVRRKQWRRLEMFLSAWVGGFLFTFTVNLCIPAVSPRIYIKDMYVHEIHGLWLCDGLRGALTTAASGTFSAFPSGHCGLSFLVPILAHRMQFYKYRNASAVAAVLIALATMVMRYHYFVDFLFSWFIVIAACWLGGFHSQQVYVKSLGEGEDEDEHDGEGEETGLPLMEIKVNGVGGIGKGQGNGNGKGNGQMNGQEHEHEGTDTSGELTDGEKIDSVTMEERKMASPTRKDSSV